MIGSITHMHHACFQIRRVLRQDLISLILMLIGDINIANIHSLDSSTPGCRRKTILKSIPVSDAIYCP